MLASLSLIFIVGLAMGAICQKLKLPRIIGILVTGIVLGPYVLDAVSPAVVVPRMVTLMEKKYGTEKAIPQMIMAGVSCDDIFVIALFTTFLSIAQGGRANVRDFVNIPVSIVLGVILGAVTGYGLYLFFETAYARKHCVRNSMKVIIVLGFSFLLSAVEGWLEEKISVSGLLAVVAMACVIAYLPKATVQAAIGSVPLAAGGRTCLWKNCSVCRCAGSHHHSSTWGNRDGCSLSKVTGKGKLKKIFRKYFGRKCVIVIAEKRK